jgi:uncharacterized protein YchJ
VDWIEEPRISIDLSATNKVQALSGRFSVYAYVNYLIDTWRGDYELWSWKGIEKTWPLFHFNYVWTPTGARAEGDVTPEDVMEVEAQTAALRLAELENKSNARLHAVMAATAADLGTPDAARVITEQSRFTTVSHAVDANVTTYLQELRRWSGS